jgi:hypothetical protein
MNMIKQTVLVFAALLFATGAHAQPCNVTAMESCGKRMTA